MDAKELDDKRIRELIILAINSYAIDEEKKEEIRKLILDSNLRNTGRKKDRHL